MIGPDMGMGAMGFVPLFGGLIVLAIIAVPIVKILHQAGYSGWWVLLWFLPLVNIIMLWVFAFSQWPALRRGGAST